MASLVSMNRVVADVPPAVEGARPAARKRSLRAKHVLFVLQKPAPPGKMPGCTAARRPAATGIGRFMVPIHGWPTEEAFHELPELCH